MRYERVTIFFGHRDIKRLSTSHETLNKEALKKVSKGFIEGCCNGAKRFLEENLQAVERRC